MARRQVSIFINGKEVENTLKSITAEKRKLVRELARMNVGSEEYNKHLAEIKRLDGVLKGHRDQLRGVENSWQKLTGGAVKFLGVAGIAFGASEIVNYLGHLGRIGVEMDTVGRKAETVLGPALALVEEQARKNATAMGLTNAQYVAAVTNLADLLVPMGFQREEAAKTSVELTNLAGALSEWTGGQFTAKEVTESLGKALLGEREELKRYGISIKDSEISARLAADGLDKLTGNALKQAQAMATLQLIIEKSADAQRQYAENSDSAVRRQAELEAKLKTITETLSRLVLPVYQKIVEVAADLSEKILSVVESIDALVNPAKAATDALDAQQRTVKNLEENINPLLDRYDELKGKTSLTKDEQDELETIINKVADALPRAVDQFDAYGRAMSINTELARELIETEKVRLQFINREAIAALEKEIKLLEQRREVVLANRKAGGTTQLSGSGFSGGFKAFTDEELRKFDQQIKEINATIQGAQAQLDFLTGKTLDNVDKLKGEDTVESKKEETQSKDKSDKSVEKELEALRKKAEELRKATERIREEDRIATLAEEEQRLEQIRQRYQKEIELAKELEKSKNKQVAEEATAQRLELERLQDEALRSEREKIFQEQLKQIAEQQDEATAQELERIFAAAEQRKAAEEQIAQFLGKVVTDEREKALQELEAHYNELLSLAQQYGIDTLDIEIAYARQRKEINEKFDKEIIENAAKAAAERAELLQGTFSAMGEVIQGVISNVSAESSRHTALMKALTLAQIAIDTAAAISSLTRNSEANPANAITAGLAGVVQFATGLARILANIAKARQVLSEAEIPQRKQGGFATVRGAQDKRTYRARLIGQPATGLLDYSTPVITASGILANEAGKEYYVSHHDLKNPAVLDHVRAIDNITRHRQMQQGGVASVSPFQNVSAAPGTDPRLQQMLDMNITLLQELLRRGVHVQLDDNTLIAMQKRLNTLISSSRGKVLT